MRFRQLLPLFGALFALYIIWGSTYFVIRIGVESWPPLMMAGVRFLSAGMLLMAFCCCAAKTSAAAPDHQRRADWSTAAGGG